MKKGTKLMAIAITALAIFFTTTVKAQSVKPDAFRFGIGLEGGIPTGDAHDGSNLELGGTARLQYGLSTNFAATLTSGYYNFFGKNVSNINGTAISGKTSSFGLVPVKAGIKAFFTPSFYFGAEAGAGFETSGVDKQVQLILSPGIGYAKKSWEVGARYENFSGPGGSNFGLVGLRIAYGFGL